MKKLFQMAAFLLTLGVLPACSDAQKKEAAQQEVEKPKVRIAQSGQREVAQIEEYTATVESDVKNNISSNSPLRIEKIYVEVGDVVRKGQLLVQMDESSLLQLKLQIDNQRVEFERTDELYKVGGASKTEWDNAKMQLEINETAYRNMLENTRLLSPVSGVVTARNYDNGDMSGGTPILTVETLAPVKMLIHVSESYYPKVTKGMPVDIRLDTYGEETFEGKVSIVYPTIDPATHTFPVEVTLKNQDNRVRPGMFARATLTFGVEKHTIVPDQAVVKQMGAGDHYVYVYEKNGTVSRKKVEVGRRLGNEYEILSGVAPDVQVVTAGHSRLADGVAVELVK